MNFNFTTRSVLEYDDYWKSIIEFNKWFVNLRFLAVVFLFVLLGTIKLSGIVELSSLQFIAIIIIIVIVLSYNIYLYRLINFSVKKNNPLLLSSFQIISDLFCLSSLIYFTGGVESPLLFFFIFHVIIGSIILPSLIIIPMTLVFVFSFIFLSVLEYYLIIPHQEIIGLNNNVIYNQAKNLFIHLATFTATVAITIFLVKKISSELYAREKKLKLALDEIKNAEASKQKYIMGVVHELKTPIAAASSLIGLILSKISVSVDDVTQKILDKTQHRLTEAISLINSILHIAKVKLETDMQKSEVDLNILFSELLISYKEIAEKKNINIKFKSTKQKLIVFGDLTLLKLAFSNLISNALKFTPENGTIEISLTLIRNEIEIKVSDSGIGIKRNETEKIFEEFFRSRNHNVEGSGFGLALVKNIIEKHNGKISVISPIHNDVSNPGTCFRIELSLHED
ncbi:MAG: hypothetical protein C0425_03470 [Chlorobiaceae bacterium]|nr:hypothetical protein [Chlorobiaceae bacterium]